jgi:hypothetical protein
LIRFSRQFMLLYGPKLGVITKAMLVELAMTGLDRRKERIPLNRDPLGKLNVPWYWRTLTNM